MVVVVTRLLHLTLAGARVQVEVGVGVDVLRHARVGRGHSAEVPSQGAHAHHVNLTALRVVVVVVVVEVAVPQAGRVNNSDRCSNSHHGSGGSSSSSSSSSSPLCSAVQASDRLLNMVRLLAWPPPLLARPLLRRRLPLVLSLPLEHAEWVQAWVVGWVVVWSAWRLLPLATACLCRMPRRLCNLRLRCANQSSHSNSNNNNNSSSSNNSNKRRRCTGSSCKFNSLWRSSNSSSNRPKRKLKPKLKRKRKLKPKLKCKLKRKRKLKPKLKCKLKRKLKLRPKHRPKHSYNNNFCVCKWQLRCVVSRLPHRLLDGTSSCMPHHPQVRRTFRLNTAQRSCPRLLRCLHSRLFLLRWPCWPLLP